jgi:hypothetical protein
MATHWHLLISHTYSTVHVGGDTSPLAVIIADTDDSVYSNNGPTADKKTPEEYFSFHSVESTANLNCFKSNY